MVPNRSGLQDAIRSKIVTARDALEKGKKKCEKMVKIADKMLSDKGY